ncbi:hypothetical protein SAMN05216252_1599 [Actinacidiphila glaucinigra]|uniref:Uncharacterized protein n=1 Tax=Actinacidiphila glaucinigra TaxID=235986 RepID=A0A239NYJ9_9ACTN|nr:hypothetical protein SAMN05216252_1599 [Actinacidiphila glaucinigra]
MDNRPVGAGETLRRAVDSLVAEGSSKVATSMEMASGGTKIAIRGSGSFDYAERRGRLQVVLPPDAAGDAEHDPVTELLTPGALYMKNRGEGVPADKWVRVDTTRLPDGNLVTGGATDPLVAAELLRAAREVRQTGAETLDGVRVRHFQGVTDIADAARVASPLVRAELAAAADGFTVTRVPFDAWLDEEGRLRKVRQRFTFSNGGGAGVRSAPTQVTVVSTTGMYGFGAPVRVTLPRATDIYTGKIVSATGP